MSTRGVSSFFHSSLCYSSFERSDTEICCLSSLWTDRFYSTPNFSIEIIITFRFIVIVIIVPLLHLSLSLSFSQVLSKNPILRWWCRRRPSLFCLPTVFNRSWMSWLWCSLLEKGVSGWLSDFWVKMILERECLSVNVFSREFIQQNDLLI